MSDWSRVVTLRYRRLVATRGRAVLATLVILVLASSVVAGVFASSPPTIESVQDRSTTVASTESHHSAVVTGDSTAYERGDDLQDQSFYLTDVAPNLTVTATATPEAEDITLKQRLVLVYQVRRSESVHWSERHTLATANGTDATTVEATVDVRDLQSKIGRLADEFGSAATVHVVIKHELRYEGADSGSRTWTAPLAIASDHYSVEGALAGPVVDTEEVTVTRPEPGSSHRLALAGNSVRLPETSLLAIVAAVLFAGAAVVVGRDARRQFDTTELDRELVRAEHEEWITTGSVELADVGTEISTDSLGDLVDVAIDSNRRVIHEPDQSRYLVLVEPGTVYYYTHGYWNPPEPTKQPGVDERPATPGEEGNPDHGKADSGRSSRRPAVDQTDTVADTGAADDDDRGADVDEGSL